MLNIGDIISIEISNLSFSGSGVGNYASDTSRAVFVPLSVPGDVLKVKITAQKKEYYEGEIAEIITPSPYRINPSCRHFGICGACDWLNIIYKKQIEEKERLLKYFFRKNNVEIPAIQKIEAVNPLYYRDKVRLKDGGFISKKSNEEIKITECHILNKCFSRLFAENLKGETCYGYDYKTKGITKGIAHYFISDIALAYLPDSFVQSNLAMNRILVEKILELADGKNILDLYCGNGNFSIPLSRKAGHVSAVEGSKEGFSLLLENMKQNIVKNMTPYNLDVHKFIQKSRKYDCIVLDPPRTGAGNVLLNISKKTGRIIYVSCNPEIMAKEIKMITDKFTIEKLIMIDMLPQTRHIEAVCLLIKKH